MCKIVTVSLGTINSNFNFVREKKKEIVKFLRDLKLLAFS